MSFLFWRKRKIAKQEVIFCPVCKRRFSAEGFVFLTGECGICHACEAKLPYTPRDGSFEGTEHLDYVLSPFYYQDPVKALLLQYKFQHQWAYGELLADITAQLLKPYPQLANFDLVLPVPLSKQRLKERGYNQSAVFARKLASILEQPIYSEALSRPVHTKRQSGLNARLRQLNVQDAFLADPKEVEGKSVLLVDDIFTTGSTMRSCAKELCSKGCTRVVGVPVTIVEPPKERLLL